jgi:hypothetical protein
VKQPVHLLWSSGVQYEAVQLPRQFQAVQVLYPLLASQSVQSIHAEAHHAVLAGGDLLESVRVLEGERVHSAPAERLHQHHGGQPLGRPCPGPAQDGLSNDHSLYRRKAKTWTKTNVQRHINLVKAGNRIPETKLTKLWRNQWSLDFPSFYLEMSVIEAMRHSPNVALSKRMIKIMEYLRDDFPNARFVDPANSANIISDDLTATERKVISAAAERALAARWIDLVK